jgi:phosphatidylinositol alpha-mannosyltransferase
VKIGIVVPYSWSFWGGVQEHADHQARALRRLGHDARIVMGHDPPGRLTWLLHPKQGRHTRPPEYVIPVGRSVIVPANASLPNIILSPQSMLRMRRVWERERFDVVHVHEPMAPVISAFALASAPCPVVVTCHSAGERLGWYPLGRALWGVLSKRIDHRIAVSDSARRAAEPYIGQPFEVIPNGIDLPARFDPLSIRWLARRRQFSLEGVDLLGGVSEDELTAELQRASLLVAPSLGGESFGMVLTRAFACATPVVASDIEGYAQVADHGETGLLVPPGDPQALEAAVVALLEDEERRRALGAAAREAAEPYSWDRIGRQLLAIYERLAAPAEAVKAAA